MRIYAPKAPNRWDGAWHHWFALRPRRVSSDTIVWLEYYRARCIYEGVTNSYWELSLDIYPPVATWKVISS